VVLPTLVITETKGIKRKYYCWTPVSV